MALSADSMAARMATGMRSPTGQPLAPGGGHPRLAQPPTARRTRSRVIEAGGDKSQAPPAAPARVPISHHDRIGRHGGGEAGAGHGSVRAQRATVGEIGQGVGGDGESLAV